MQKVTRQLERRKRLQFGVSKGHYYSRLLNMNILASSHRYRRHPNYRRSLHLYWKSRHTSVSPVSTFHPLRIRKKALSFVVAIVANITVRSILTNESSGSLPRYFYAKSARHFRLVAVAFYRNISLLVKSLISSTVVLSFRFHTATTLVAFYAKSSWIKNFIKI